MTLIKSWPLLIISNELLIGTTDSVITFLLGFLVMLVAFLGLAAGIFLGRPPIRGSCGGLSQLGFQCSCKQPCANRQQRFARDLAAIDNRDVAIDDH